MIARDGAWNALISAGMVSHDALHCDAMRMLLRRSRPRFRHTSVMPCLLQRVLLLLHTHHQLPALVDCCLTSTYKQWRAWVDGSADTTFVHEIICLSLLNIYLACELATVLPRCRSNDSILRQAFPLAVTRWSAKPQGVTVSWMRRARNVACAKKIDARGTWSVQSGSKRQTAGRTRISTRTGVASAEQPL